MKKYEYYVKCKTIIIQDDWKVNVYFYIHFLGEGSKPNSSNLVILFFHKRIYRCIKVFAITKNQTVSYDMLQSTIEDTQYNILDILYETNTH